MQNDLEKNIAQRMQEFSIAPQPEIWQQVEAALPPQKKRRIAIWWWLLPLFILMGIGFWMITGKKNTTPNAATTQHTPAKKEKIQHPISTVTNTDSVDKRTLTETTKKVTEPAANPLHTNAIKHSGNWLDTATDTAKIKRVVKLYTSLNKAKQLKQTVQKNEVSDKYSGSQTTITHAGKDVIASNSISTKEFIETPLQNAGSSILPGNTDTTSGAVKTGLDSTTATNETVAQKSIDTAKQKADTNAVVHAGISKKSSAYKQTVSWMLEAGAGLSWQQFKAIGSAFSYNNGQYSNSPVTGQPVYNAPFQAPKSGYGLSMGISRRQTITPHWSWAVALRYQLITSVQRAGYPRTSSTSLDTRNSYSTGDTLSYNNYLHLLQVAPRISYTIDSKAHSPVSFSTGFSVGYVFFSNQLLPNYRNYVYVQSPQGLVRWQHAAEVGASLFFRKKINIGVSYQHGLSNLVQPDLISSLRWRVLQMHIGLPLFHHSSK